MGLFGGVDPGADPVTPEELYEWKRRQGGLFNFDPSVSKDRLELLPRYTKDKGWIAPHALVSLVGGVEASSHAARGVGGEGDALNMMQNFAYGGLGRAALGKQAPGELGMLLGGKNIDTSTTRGKIALLNLFKAKDEGITPAKHEAAKKLGAWIGPEGEPRYWVSDMAASIDEKAWENLGNKVAVPLGNILKHPELKELAPDLLDNVKIKKMSVEDYLRSVGKSVESLEPTEALEIVKKQQKRLGGFFDPSNRTLYINPKRITDMEDLMKITLHELSHDVQNSNNWAFGANASEVVKKMFRAQMKSQRTDAGKKAWEDFVDDSLNKMFPRDPDQREAIKAGLKSGDKATWESAAHLWYSRLHGELEAEVPGEMRKRLLELRKQYPEVAKIVEGKSFNPATSYDDIFSNSLIGSELDNFLKYDVNGSRYGP